MVSLVKISPIEIKNGVLRVATQSVKDHAPVLGDVAYIWFEETSGGNGLAYRGVISDIRTQTDFEVSDLIPIQQALRKSDLQPLRDAPDNHPLSSLATKLFKYSLNGSRTVSSDECQFLDSHF